MCVWHGALAEVSAVRLEQRGPPLPDGRTTCSRMLPGGRILFYTPDVYTGEVVFDARTQQYHNGIECSVEGTSKLKAYYVRMIGAAAGERVPGELLISS